VGVCTSMYMETFLQEHFLYCYAEKKQLSRAPSLDGTAKRRSLHDPQPRLQRLNLQSITRCEHHELALLRFRFGLLLVQFGLYRFRHELSEFTLKFRLDRRGEYVVLTSHQRVITLLCYFRRIIGVFAF
jgi:hypothetical protein